MAGVQWALSRFANIKVGWRYIHISNVPLYGYHSNIDTGALEAGLNFRF